MPMDDGMPMRVESLDDLPGRVAAPPAPAIPARTFSRPIIPGPGLPGPGPTTLLPSELLRIEARLDRISEQVDACLTEIAGDRSAVAATSSKATLQRQASCLSGRGELLGSSASLRRHMVPFHWDRAESQDFEEHEKKLEKSFSGVLVDPEVSFPKEGVPLRRNRLSGPVRSLDIRLATQILEENSDRLSAEHRPMQRLLHHRHRCDVVWELLEEPHSSRAAWLMSQILKVLVILSVTGTILQLSEDPTLDGTTAALMETFFDCVFLVEFLARILSAPSKKEYLKDAFNWADIASASGLPLRASIGFAMSDSNDPARQCMQAILLFVLPLARFLKLLRYFETIRLLIDAFRKSLEALPVLMYTMALTVLVSTFALYLSETRGNIPSIQHSLWLCVVTMTTVGYGDYAPKSLGGYIIMSILTIVSVLFLAMPVGIIGNEFTIC